MKLRKHPHLLEINAFAFLDRLSKKYGKTLTLASIPAGEWEAVAALGFDAVWLMGVWRRSPAARQCALKDVPLRKRYAQVLPQWTESDIEGSPYAVYGYELDPYLGQPEDLKKAKAALNRAGLALILDYVPNHLAMDHPWTLKHPECFIEGSEKDSLEQPGHFFRTPHLRYLAHGRDPNFPAWGDTVQVNYFSPLLRKFTVETLIHVAQFADGVRCDMAMLGLHAVFKHVWGPFLKHLPVPEKEFWDEVLPAVKKHHPDFIFMAEVYWDLEHKLQSMGFDFTYDKRLYDRLLHAGPPDVAHYLKTPTGHTQRSVHFIENHDEARAMTVFGREKSYAAAMVIATAPGLRFFHDGQIQGRKIHLPVQMKHEFPEAPDPGTEKFYRLLLDYVNPVAFHEGEWHMHRVEQCWEDNCSHANLLSWSWQYENQIRWVVINYSPYLCQGRVHVPAGWHHRGALVLKDRFSGETYFRDLKEIGREGLFVELGPWRAHLFETEFK